MAIHNRFLTFTLDKPLALRLPDHLETSHALTSDLDLFVSSLYSPQSEEDVLTGATGVIKNATGLCDLTLTAIGQADAQEEGAAAALGKLSLDTVTRQEPAVLDPLEKEKKWMDVWKQQMDKAQAARSSRI